MGIGCLLQQRAHGKQRQRFGQQVVVVDGILA